MSFKIKYNENPTMIWVFGEGEEDWVKIKNFKNFKQEKPSK